MDKSKSQTLNLTSVASICAGGFIFGIFIASLFHTLQWGVLFLYSIGVFGIVLVFFSSKIRILVLLFIFATLVGYGRYELSIPAHPLNFSNKENVSLIGIAYSVAHKNGGSQFVIDVDEESILVRSDAPNIAYGDRVYVSGQIALPENFTTGVGTEFDYISYLYKDNIIYLLQDANVHVESHDNGNWILAHLLQFNSWVENGIQKVFSSKDADLVSGLLLGNKQNIDSEIRDELVATGTIHIVALSGYNVSIIAEEIRIICARIGLGLSTSFFGGIFGVIVFVLMTGAQSSAMRAGIMAVIMLIGRRTGHVYGSTRALIIAGVCMLLINPRYLMYDVSFQLSFLATIGIIYITPWLEHHLYSWKVFRIPRMRFFAEMICVTLGAQIAVMPYIAYAMGTLSIVALPANMLILPTIPYIMGIGAFTGVTSYILGPIAHLLAYPAHILLAYLFKVVHIFASLSFASITFKNVPIIFVIGIYITGGILIFRFYKKQDIFDSH